MKKRLFGVIAFGVSVLLSIGLAGPAVARTKKPKPVAAPSGPQGTQDEARQLLEELARPNVDVKTLSAKLQPKAADYAAIFIAGSAVKAQTNYDKEWAGGKMVITHAPDQTDLKLFAAKVDEIANGKGQGVEFPGGYKKVIAQFKPGVTIYAWRFVRPGEKTGMAYDGLVFVNGHFVWLPKPWRAL